MQSEILRLFEGLTPSQVKEFRRRIVPALEEVRREVTAEPAALFIPRAQVTTGQKTSRTYTGGKRDAMRSEN